MLGRYQWPKNKTSRQFDSVATRRIFVTSKNRFCLRSFPKKRTLGCHKPVPFYRSPSVISYWLQRALFVAHFWWKNACLKQALLPVGVARSLGLFFFYRGKKKTHTLPCVEPLSEEKKINTLFLSFTRVGCRLSSSVLKQLLTHDVSISSFWQRALLICLGTAKRPFSFKVRKNEKEKDFPASRCVASKLILTNSFVGVTDFNFSFSRRFRKRIEKKPTKRIKALCLLFPLPKRKKKSPNLPSRHKWDLGRWKISSSQGLFFLIPVVTFPIPLAWNSQRPAQWN